MNYFKGMKYEDIRPIFEKVWDQIQSFAPMDSEKEKYSKKKKESRKKSLVRKRAGEKQSEESTKRQKIEDDVEKEELKAYLDLVPREEFAMEIDSLATKLVKARYMTSSPEGYKLMLWGDLKILFEPDEKDEVWRNQHEYNLISSRLFDSCGIHILLMNNGISIHMMIEKKYPLTQEMLSKMLSKKLEVWRGKGVGMDRGYMVDWMKRRRLMLMGGERVDEEGNILGSGAVGWGRCIVGVDSDIGIVGVGEWFVIGLGRVEGCREGGGVGVDWEWSGGEGVGGCLWCGCMGEGANDVWGGDGWGEWDGLMECGDVGGGIGDVFDMGLGRDWMGRRGGRSGGDGWEGLGGGRAAWRGYEDMGVRIWGGGGMGGGGGGDGKVWGGTGGGLYVDRVADGGGEGAAGGGRAVEGEGMGRSDSAGLRYGVGEGGSRERGGMGGGGGGMDGSGRGARGGSTGGGKRGTGGPGGAGNRGEVRMWMWGGMSGRGSDG
ncbi:hypothetical protein Tco_0356821 [Tanacetum coccineum]